jgi:uncharacterized membrane protein
MLRSRLLNADPTDKRGFRFRSREVSRLEAFSDCVFAFALTLIVVSLEVPRTIEHLLSTMKSFPVFGVCFAALLNVWWVHHRFFRRYGLTDLPVFLLNSVLLFMVLFFVYPLRFLFGQLLRVDAPAPMDVEQGRDMFTVYGGGFAAVYLVFALMYFHAWRLREKLELDELERWMTLETIAHHLVLAAVGLLSIVVARLAPPAQLTWAGWIFFVIPIPMTIVGSYFGKRISALERELPGRVA